MKHFPVPKENLGKRNMSVNKGTKHYVSSAFNNAHKICSSQKFRNTFKEWHTDNTPSFANKFNQLFILQLFAHLNLFGCLLNCLSVHFLSPTYSIKFFIYCYLILIIYIKIYAYFCRRKKLLAHHDISPLHKDYLSL